MQVSLFGGTFLRLDKQGVPLAGEDDRHRSSSKSPWAAEVQGFNVHAGVVLHKGDREGLERLCRYGARPALSLQRLSILPDGRVAYALRKPRKNGATHLVLSPVQFLARIAALVPPPRFPLLRFAGVLAPKSPWRKDVVPHPQSATSAPASTPAKKDGKKKTAATASAAAAPLGDLPANGQRPPLADAPKGPRTSLGEGIVPPVYARIDWASLLKRTYLEDVLACPCGGRRQILADITDPEVVVAILAHLGLATQPPPLARARAPTLEAA